MFKVKQQIIACRIGIPELLNISYDLSINDTQFDSLFYFFLTDIECMNCCDNFKDFVSGMHYNFESIRSQINMMCSKNFSNGVTLVVFFATKSILLIVSYHDGNYIRLATKDTYLSCDIFLF